MSEAQCVAVPVVLVWADGALVLLVVVVVVVLTVVSVMVEFLPPVRPICSVSRSDCSWSLIHSCICAALSYLFRSATFTPNRLFTSGTISTCTHTHTAAGFMNTTHLSWREKTTNDHWNGLSECNLMLSTVVSTECWFSTRECLKAVSVSGSLIYLIYATLPCVCVKCNVSRNFFYYYYFSIDCYHGLYFWD